MDLIQDGVRVLCPIGCCQLDEQRRAIENMEECPQGKVSCNGDCFYYSEDETNL